MFPVIVPMLLNRSGGSIGPERCTKCHQIIHSTLKQKFEEFWWYVWFLGGILCVVSIAICILITAQDWIIPHDNPSITLREVLYNEVQFFKDLWHRI